MLWVRILPCQVRRLQGASWTTWRLVLGHCLALGSLSSPGAAHSGFRPASSPAEMGTALWAENGTRSQMLSSDTHTLTPRKYLSHANLGRGSAQKSGRVKWLKYPFLFWVCRGSHAASGQCDLSCPCWIAPRAAQPLCALLCLNTVLPGGPGTVPVTESLGRPLGPVHGCPCATRPRSPAFLQSRFFKPFYVSPALLSSRRRLKEGCKSHPWVLSPAVLLTSQVTKEAPMGGLSLGPSVI